MKTKPFVAALAWIGGTALLSLGCVAHAQAGGYADAEAPVVFVEPPTLVEVDTDIWVVRDYDYPVYYVEGSYWVYRDNIWWRSTAYDRGWARADVNVVPAVIVHRDHRAYVRYHGNATAKTRPGPREHLASDHDDHRGPPDHAAEQHGGPPGHNDVPGVGNQRKPEDGNQGNARHEDKKDERKVDRDDRKEERREDRKEEKRDEKKDDKKDDKKGGPKKK
jgi:hypothetical protein